MSTKHDPRINVVSMLKGRITRRHQQQARFQKVSIHRSVENLLAEKQNLFTNLVPEVQLYKALIEDALIRVVTEQTKDPAEISPRRRMEIEEIKDWLYDDSNRVCSFKFCCDVTGIDESFLRQLFNSILSRDYALLESLHKRFTREKETEERMKTENRSMRLSPRGGRGDEI